MDIFAFLTMDLLEEVNMKYNIYRKKINEKHALPRLIEVCSTWREARQACKDYKEIMEENGYKGKYKYFYKRRKRVRSA